MYYGRRHGKRSFTPKRKESTPITTLQKLGRLSLHDLKKVQKAYEKYLGRRNEAQSRNAAIEKLNKAALEEFEARNKRQESATEHHRINQIQPLEREIKRLESSLEAHRVGFISSLVVDTVTYKGYNNRYRKSAQSIIESIDRLWSRLHAANDATPKPLIRTYDLKLQASVKLPNDHVDITVAGVKTRVEFTKIDVDELTGLIEKFTRQQLKENEKRDSEIRNLRARAAENEEQVRALSKHDRNELREQLDVLEFCPYCGGHISERNAHKDHIYPVAKGGKSFHFNLVYVCSNCNMKKRDTFLRDFLISQGHDLDEVYERLDTLGKKF